ncbi:kinetochore Sim4 complex subunit FTA2-domain-containing protein [Dactylonectria macrodidyma]|uniref:Kinetochore Sim4 complex subunit FTA2-domain-containing protein n=1 Tax=Dactylonectria macrodidyma TaxID=307937 RepID=A0A9P9EA54_9HYPO|nr:kinetochore Sim4 complex subunit FTA2-domain-containing protein [Dactylonectria macrodidyma]
MHQRHSPEAIPKELPLCDGPKLHMFKHHASRIQWLERLGNDLDGTPAEGYVFRAKIKNRYYAVKVFKFHDPMSNDHFWEPLLGKGTPLETVSYYTDPFYAECRAYGRIHEAVKRGLLTDVAIPCHGFVFLREQDEEILRDRNIDLELGNVDPQYQRSTVGGCRARAIVKDLASADTGVDGKSLQRALLGIIALNRQRIYNMDIRLDNYRDGQIVDFGSSWTEPHILLDALHSEAAYDSRLADRTMFDEMVEDEEIPNPKKLKAVHPMKLRSQRA